MSARDEVADVFSNGLKGLDWTIAACVGPAAAVFYLVLHAALPGQFVPLLLASVGFGILIAIAAFCLIRGVLFDFRRRGRMQTRLAKLEEQSEKIVKVMRAFEDGHNQLVQNSNKNSEEADARLKALEDHMQLKEMK